MLLKKINLPVYIIATLLHIGLYFYFLQSFSLDHVVVASFTIFGHFLLVFFVYIVTQKRKQNWLFATLFAKAMLIVIAAYIFLRLSETLLVFFAAYNLGQIIVLALSLRR
ncbi:MAG: hypothetical protein H6621_06740 [Halobacteriovoraceae bacterium]|nr:hypothetical protein [Halobacteriovoraceae bacterium]